MAGATDITGDLREEKEKEYDRDDFQVEVIIVKSGGRVKLSP
jgi:hypothetical protein